MGTHISKVKSMSLDIWTKEQVDSMRNNGNLKSNLYYNPNPRLNPALDTESEDAQSQLERFIFKKYKDKAFIAAAAAQSPEAVKPSTTRRSNVATIETAQGSTSGRKAASPLTPSVSITPSYTADLPATNLHSSLHSQQLSPATMSAGRAMTAPLPEQHTTRSSTSSPAMYSQNPYLRHMTASAQLPYSSTTSTLSTYASTSPAMVVGQTAYSTHQPLCTPQYSSAPTISYPSHIPQVQHKGEVWDDLSSLSLAGPSSYHQSTLNGSHVPSYRNNIIPSIQTNPFLSSSSMPYKSPSQVSSLSSGSSFSSLGNASVSSSFTPQSMYQPPSMQLPHYQSQAQAYPLVNQAAAHNMPYVNFIQQPAGLLSQNMYQAQVQHQQPLQQPYYHKPQAINPFLAHSGQPYSTYASSQYQQM
jgi:stromal membrane-associated protein